MIPEAKRLPLIAGLRQVLNADGIDNDLGTPDIFLAGYLLECLEAFGRATGLRAQWFGDVLPHEQLAAKLGLHQPPES